MSDDHFTVDGTLIQAWASHKSFRRKGGSDGDGTNFHASSVSSIAGKLHISKSTLYGYAS